MLRSPAARWPCRSPVPTLLLPKMHVGVLGSRVHALGMSPLGILRLHVHVLGPLHCVGWMDI